MIVVIGAGITGLAAAYELTQRGVPFVVLEASPRAGGLILTEHVDGFTIDGGPDSVLVQKPGAIQLCNELGLGSRMIATRAPRTAFVLKDGHLFPLPSPSVLGIPTTWTGLAGFDLLPPAARARLALEPTMRRAETDNDESVASFFRRRFGEATVDLIAQPLVGGIHSGDVESLSMRSLFPRLVDAEARHGSVLNAFRQSRTNASEGLFRSLPAGMGELVTAIERRMPARSIRLRTPATAIAGAEGRWRVSAGEETFAASAVILTTPSYVTAELLAPLDTQAAQLCRETRYVSTASVVLAWPRVSVSHPLAGSGFVVARSHSELRITACTWVSSKWTGRAPEGSTLFRAFLGGVHDTAAATLQDEALTGIAVSDLSAVLGISDAPTLARIYRWPNASAQYNVGHLTRVAALEARLSAYPGLLLAGSGFKSIGIPDCVTDGRAAAARAVRFG
jgi:oxygen-dependent protoporphyrinogen oxidase